MVTAQAKLKKAVNKERLDMDREMGHTNLPKMNKAPISYIYKYVMFDVHKRMINVLHRLVVCIFVLTNKLKPLTLG